MKTTENETNSAAMKSENGDTEKPEISLNTDEASEQKGSGPTKKLLQDGSALVLDVPMREFTFDFGTSGHIAFNPLTSFIGIIALWALAIWCMVDPEYSNQTLSSARSSVSLMFSWLIVGQKPVSLFFVLFIAYKFGHIKLGGKDEKPEYDGAQFFTMIFAAGVAVGIFYYGVAEPLWHQNSNWFANGGYRSQDEVDQMAVTYTLFHWGFDAWAGYITVAIATALASYRFHLPLTFRSCFYPIFGDYTWGWIGDVIDGFSIVVTVSGVCTSLGLGAIQVTAGLQRLGWIDSDVSADETVNIQIALIWVITGIATASVISGLDVGVRLLSMFAFGLGMALTFVVLILENTPYILNLQVQSVGHYLQWAILQMNFHTGAFGQLREGEGRAVDGQAAEEWWMDAWTIFYWNWWVSWSCFVGLFVARISRGRTIGEVIGYSLIAPFLYCVVWFCIWGGIGLRQSRQALELQKLGETYFNDTEYFLHGTSEFCFDVPQEDLLDNGTVIFTNYHKGITPVCLFESTDASSFNVLYSFSYSNVFGESGMGPTLTVLYLFAVAVYFCTSSDSGSLVVDFLASNGRHEHHWLQRLFWALTEGAVATALLTAGGTDGLAAVQAASVISGLPFTVFLIFLMQTIYEFCSLAMDDDQQFYEFSGKKHFRMPVYGGIFNVFETLASAGNVHAERVALGMDRPASHHVVEFAKGVFVPFVSLYEVVSKFYPAPTQRKTNLLTVGVYTLMHFSWIALFITVYKYPPLRAWGWVAYFVNGCLLTSLKMDYRGKNDVHGTILGDFLTATFFFPQVLAQLVIEIREGDFVTGAPEEKEQLLQAQESNDENMESEVEVEQPTHERQLSC